ncbi:hypothetical protein SISSUDRAFT_92647 [Sistotremastrum suecicum HHB10207 ss-3]|uniref:F-box domain-containing protein n=1 Tax=Sistotremastrum suecicum HHB10207 ss-3 TaxID=1314776 RepID=A0A166B9A2_9AGAM|nr:hypothetical protein SISSUDRAFT_92647 [Sistotremastrum suecicum HHB10207 ss-3]
MESYKSELEHRCTRWRRIAVNTPSLWTTICLPSNPKFFRLFRDRSEGLPLTIYLSSCELSSKQTVEDDIGDPLRQLLPRIARLHVDWHDPDLQAFFSRHIGGTELPSLVSLDVKDFESSHMPYTFNAPLLRRFRFFGPSDNAFLVPFGDLVEFNIHSFRLEPGEILDILSLLPRVKFCDIGNTDPSEVPTQDFGDRAVALHNLQTLSIGTLTIPDIACVVKHLHIPSSATMSLSVEEEESAESGIETLVGPLLEETHELLISDRESIRMPDTIFTLKSKKRAKVLITHSLLREHTPKLPSLAKLAVYGTSLNTLTLHLPILPDTTSLVTALSSWTLISQICVSTEERQFDKLLIALETPGTLCPKLHTLNCTGTRFSSTRMKYFLQSRKDNRVPLQELKFTKGFAEPNAASFSSLVPTLIEYDPALSKCGFTHPSIRGCRCNLGT